ncbi:hypothetical protein [Streptomyces sp. NPDC058572]|uniref:hypothetical protein n=1 Tax=Streptomyces sp. NPDC058572 TaxID=3346546 RepID=UPI003647B6BA
MIAALAEVQLLADDEIRRSLAELADATFTLHHATDQEDLATRSIRTRAAADEVVNVVGRVVRS